jgi:cytochrome o ubiquinol oxidase subunit III
MIESAAAQQVERNNSQHDADSKTIFGFWVYLMTDCLLFASLFATFVVLRHNTWDGPSAIELFSMPFVLTETLILLTSSFTCGLAMLAVRQHQKTQALGWLAVTFLLGLSFVGLEISEFAHMASEGHDWQTSGFLSAFFTLVGTHGLHITAGLIWALVLLWQMGRKGPAGNTAKRMTMFSLFWHFLDIVWIFIFTVVYLIGVSST